MSEFFETIHVKDPAIDWRRVPQDVYDHWIETRKTALLAPYVVPGKQPIIFVLREISQVVMDHWVDMGSATATTYTRAFQAALVLVRNMPTKEGLRPEWEPPKQTDPGAFQGIVRDECLGDFTRAMRRDVGALAYQRSDFLPGTPATFVMPPMFRDSLGPPPVPSAEPSSQSPPPPNDTQ